MATALASMHALLGEYYTYYAYMKDHEALVQHLAEEALLNKCIKVRYSHECKDWYRPVHDRLFELCRVYCDGTDVEYIRVRRVAVFHDEEPLDIYGHKCEPFEDLATEETLDRLTDSLETLAEMVTKRNTCLECLQDLAYSEGVDTTFYHGSIIRREKFTADLMVAMEHRYEMSRVV